MRDRRERPENMDFIVGEFCADLKRKLFERFCRGIPRKKRSGFSGQRAEKKIRTESTGQAKISRYSLPITCRYEIGTAQVLLYAI